MPVENPTVEDYFRESDRHDADDAEAIPEDVRARVNEALADE